MTHQEEDMWDEIAALAKAGEEKDQQIAELEDDVAHLKANIAYLYPLTEEQRLKLAQTIFRLIPRSLVNAVQRAPPDEAYRLDALNRDYYTEEQALKECQIATLCVSVNRARQAVTLDGYCMVNGTLNRQGELEVRRQMREYAEREWPQCAVTMTPVRHLDGV
jgi:hypothetical protein